MASWADFLLLLRIASYSLPRTGGGGVCVLNGFVCPSHDTKGFFFLFARSNFLYPETSASPVGTDFGALGRLLSGEGRETSKLRGTWLSLPTKAPGTSRPLRRPREDFILFFFFFLIFKLHIKTLPYSRRVSTGAGVWRGEGPGAPGERSPPRPTARPAPRFVL